MWFESHEVLVAYLEENPGLDWLELESCPGLLDLKELPALLSRLRVLLVRDFQALASLSALPPALKTLFVVDCPCLTELPDLPSELTELVVKNCPSLALPSVFPTSLARLSISGFQALVSLPALPSEMTELPEVSSQSTVVRVYSCPNLPGYHRHVEDIYDEDTLE